MLVKATSEAAGQLPCCIVKLHTPITTRPHFDERMQAAPPGVQDVASSISELQYIKEGD